MSWARRGEDSDVYVFEQNGGEVCCCACTLLARSGVFDDVVAVRGEELALRRHFEEHREAGDKVPARVWARLMEWIERRRGVCS